jgi:hypothetical protein
LLIGGATLCCLVAAAAAFFGVTWYRINHAVHHVSVAVSPALLASGRNDLLTMVKGPHGSEQIYIFHTVGGHTNVLLLPSSLAVTGTGGRTEPLSSFDIHTPTPIITGLARLGIPVGRYLGVDLHAVNPQSSLGQLADGKTSMTTLISHPAGTASLLEAVASHVYLGPGTSVSALLSLMHVPLTTPVHVPTQTDPQGHVVLAAPASGVLRRFL